MIDTSMLRFDTVFDDPPPPTRAPFKISRGDHPAVRVTDSFVRDNHGIGRCEGSPALIGLKLAKPDQPVRVTISLRATVETGATWRRFAPERVASREAYQPRVLLVRSQGATRAVVVIAREPGAFAYDSRHVVRFDVQPSELSDDGLLVIELAEPAEPPLWAMSQLAPHPAAGVEITAVDVSASHAAAPSRLEPPASGDGLIAVGTDTFAGAGSWRLRADARRQPRADLPSVDRGAPWGPRPPSAPKLRMREKAVAIIRRRVEDLLVMAGRSISHVVWRARRMIAAPLTPLTAGVQLRAALRRGEVRAQVVTFDGATAIEASIRGRSWRDIEVTPARPVTGPALLCVRAGRRPLRWQLRAATS